MPTTVALTCDLNGSLEQLTRLLHVMDDFGVKGTFLISPKLPAAGKGSFGGRPDEDKQFKLLADGNHEICSHTFSHPFDLTSLSPKDMEEDIVHGHESLMKSFGKYIQGFKINGFRAPAQVFDERAFPIFQKLNYTWDSSQVYFPALGKPFEPSMYGTIVEIPVLFPNDSALLDKYRLSLAKEEQILKEAFDASKNYFVFTVHPFCTARSDDNVQVLAHLLAHMKRRDAKFATLSSVTESIKQSEMPLLKAQH